jgi:hypothetical protein
MARSHRAIAGAAQVYECPAELLAALAGSLLGELAGSRLLSQNNVLVNTLRLTMHCAG